MKIIFLDIDGVLNTSNTFENIYYEYKKTGKTRIEIDLYRLEYLKKIVNETNALIVLSSSWRIYFNKTNNGIIPNSEKGLQLKNLFDKYKLLIYDITPITNTCIRQNEILKWMENKDISNYIVIDDEESNLSVFINNGLIKTYFTSSNKLLIDNCCGLCEKHINQAIDILNVKNNKLVKRLQ